MGVCVVADPGACWRIPGEDWVLSCGRLTELALLAKHAGADVFKIQVLRRGMYSDSDPNAALVAQYEVPDLWLAPLSLLCDINQLEFMATCYRAEDIPIINPYVRRLKIASFDVGNEPLLTAVLATKKPLIVSLGLGQEPEEVKPQRRMGDAFFSGRVTPLHCVSAYPALPETMNLRRILEWNGDDCDAEHPMGLSDHTRGNTAAIVAVAMGATIIEKHIRHEETPEDNPDYAAAASPDEFRAYVAAIREAELMLGDGEHRIQPGERTDLKFNPAIGRRGGW